MNPPITLLLPEKNDIEFDQVLAIWTARGGHIKRLGKYWIKDEVIAASTIAIYGNQTFSLVLAQLYNVELISPDDTLIARLDKKWVKRDIQLAQIGSLSESSFPAFAKPVIPKLFLAGVFQNLASFQDATQGLQVTEEVLVSTIIERIDSEARSYVMDGGIKDIALYEGEADLKEGRLFLTQFLDDNKEQLPPVVVIDLGYNNSIGWFILEFNACWGAGLNNCRAEYVIDCIAAATINKKQ
jgi:hypothetical protein